MPNGGSDCCGTCWFNAQNKGDAGYGHADRETARLCTIRGLKIRSPAYTYCGNHPYRRPDRDPIPIGPVFVDDHGYRKQWQSSPDTEEVRQHLLELVHAISEQPEEEYPIGIYTDEIVVWQLGEFREMRAADDLRRIAAFSPKTSGGQFDRTRGALVAIAENALRKLNEKVEERTADA